MRRKFLLSILLVVALTTILSALLHTRARSLEADLNARIQRHADALQAQHHRHDHLKQNLSSPAPDDASKSALLKLRAEVADLRRSTTNLHALRTSLTNLQNEIQIAQSAISTNTQPTPDPSKIRASWTKDQITFAGYADETSALQSTLWAMSRGQPTAILSAFASEEFWKKRAIAERDLTLQSLAASLRPVTAFHLVSDDIAPRIPEIDPALKVYKIHFEGDGATRGLGFKKVGDQLKFVTVFAIGGTDEHPTYESNLWP